jgi:hypothetical protein
MFIKEVRNSVGNAFRGKSKLILERKELHHQLHSHPSLLVNICALV